MTNSALAEYKSVHEAVGILDLSDRGKLKVTGADRVDFLHSMISNDVRGLADYEGRYATLLTPNGKIVADFSYYRFPDHVLIDVENSLLPRLVATLEKYIIMDEVFLEDVSDAWAHISLQGPRSEKLVESLFGVPAPREAYHLVEASFDGRPAWIVARGQLADQGFEVLLSAGQCRDLIRKAVHLAALQVGPEAAEVLRLERGIPRFGVDMEESNYPMEVGLTSAISLTKGCYLGQEVVSKATHVGGVSRRLVRLLLENDRPVDKGTRLLSEEGKPIGHLTSSAVSPVDGRTIALGYVKREWAVAGKRVWVEEEASRRVSAEITDGALVR